MSVRLLRPGTIRVVHKGARDPNMAHLEAKTHTRTHRETLQGQTKRPKQVKSIPSEVVTNQNNLTMIAGVGSAASKMHHQPKDPSSESNSSQKHKSRDINNAKNQSVSRSKSNSNSNNPNLKKGELGFSCQ